MALIWGAIPRSVQQSAEIQTAIDTIQAKLDEVDALPTRQVQDLRDALGRYLPRTVPDRAQRIDATATALHRMGVKAIDLPGLISTSRIRDAMRHWTAVLRTGLSFLPAAGAGLGLALNPAYDKAEYTGDKADDVGERNIYVAYLIGLLCMGVGGQVAGRVVEDGRLGPKYNKPAPVTRGNESVPYAETTRAMVAKGFEFYPFSIGHGTVGSGVLDLAPEGTAKAFVLSTFLSSVATGMSSALLNETLPPEGLDYTWLDASTPAKQDAMRTAVEHLKESSLVALGGYAKDIGTGIKGLTAATGEEAPEGALSRLVAAAPGKQALKGALFRLIAAVVATFPRLFYASTKNEDDKAVLGLIAGLWIGLSWGWLGMGLFQPVNDPNAKPASPAEAAAVAPSDAETGEQPDPSARV